MNRSKKVALVTGATGFVGKHLCKRLIYDKWEVHAIIRPTSNVLGLNNFVNGGIIFHCYDGMSKEMVNIISNVKPTVVFHLASLFLSQHTFSDIAPLIDSNILFSTQLFEAMAQNKTYNLINTGTSWQHYNNAAYNPVCLYAATKQASKDILKYYQEAEDLKVITLNLFDTYGPYDTRDKLFNLLRKVSQTNRKLAMSPGEQYIDLVYIDDVVDAFALAAEYLINEEYLYVGDYSVKTGKSLQLKELVKIYEEILGKKLNIQWGGRPYREREVMRPWCIEETLPNWFPKVNVREGIIHLLTNGCR